MSEKNYLRDEQYKDASNLNARIQLHRDYGTGKQSWVDWLWEQFEIPADAHILELGSGAVTLWDEGLECVSKDWHITLSDFSPGMLEVAQTTLAGRGIDFDFRQINAEAIPFDDDTFDVVIANHMLYHVPDLDKALAEIVRVLKPGGKLYAATNGNRHMHEIGEVIQQIYPEHSTIMTRIGHMHFRLETGGERLEKHFAKVEMRDYDNNILVDKAQPVIDYIMSGLVLPGNVNDEQIDTMRAYVQSVIDAEGALTIQKHTGLFIAYND